jgi:hypothetical protein
MTTADLACWFGRHYSSIRGWLKQPVQLVPSPATRETYRLLDLLERTVEKDKRFPIPPDLGQRYRRQYVEELVRDYVNRDRSRLFKAGAAR